jgi:hypothetical protein
MPYTISLRDVTSVDLLHARIDRYNLKISHSHHRRNLVSDTPFIQIHR